ncbi:hypothetical protein [Bacillus sp. NEB1478]|uniref:hypothetical protein n=1 Tax=Bacillus sp. NEB1478 TaxID=3073816 RepID=UPI00287348D3|nr:hypothetical protein [Bacillus sp. NEB1478]WNB91644.1 hypothetical protein RGB74_17475 [Bacillus sp. NEB1478]
MRIRNLFIQGLIAGAVLFIPTAVFAEKGEQGRSQPDAQQHGQFTAQSKQSSEQNRQTNDERNKSTERSNNKNVSASKAQKSPEKQHVQVKRKQSEVSKTKLSQQSRQQNENEHNKLKRQQIIQLPNAAPVVHKRIISTPSTKQPSVKPEKMTAAKNRMVNESKKATLPAERSTSNPVHGEQIKRVQKIPLDFPLDKSTEQPDTTVIPVNAGQNSTHSSQTNDGGMGAANIASIKASLSLPVIFQDGEKVFVYFSRLDLLRSQWVNAPPSKPPKSAL